jgi:hypothetical protein
VPTAAFRAQEIAARLAAAGCEPRITHHPDHIHIETEIPEEPPPVQWKTLLGALELGDQFGLRGKEDPLTAWATVSTEERTEAEGDSRDCADQAYVNGHQE